MQLLKHNRSRDIRSYSDLLINVSPPTNKMGFGTKSTVFKWGLTQNLLFSSAGIFRMHILQAIFHHFRQESGLFTLLMMEKDQKFTSKKGQGAFWTSKKKGRARCLPKNMKHEHY